MFTLPEDAAQLEAYQQLSPMAIPGEAGKRSPRKKKCRGRPPCREEAVAPVHGRGPGQTGALPFWGSFRGE